MRILIERYPSDVDQTLGVLYILNQYGGVEFSCNTLELPWLNNTRRVSCIPVGLYTGVIHNSPKFGKCIWIKDVPNRSEILIHVANYNRQLLGCIAPGLYLKDIDGDNVLDVSSSKKALEKILSYVDKEIEIEII